MAIPTHVSSGSLTIETVCPEFPSAISDEEKQDLEEQVKAIEKRLNEAEKEGDN